MLKIKKEFQDLIPPLNSEEYSQLEKNCIEDGIRDKIIIWDDYIVDGHNRFNIAEKHNLKYETEEIALDNEEDVKVFIINLQLGRRNLVEFVKIELLQIRKENIKMLAEKTGCTEFHSSLRSKETSKMSFIHSGFKDSAESYTNNAISSAEVKELRNALIF